MLYCSALLEPILNRKRTNRAPRPLPAVAGAKTKNFPYLSSFLRRGVWGEPTKNGKEIFGFASPVAYIVFYHTIVSRRNISYTQSNNYDRFIQKTGSKYEENQDTKAYVARRYMPRAWC